MKKKNKKTFDSDSKESKKKEKNEKKENPLFLTLSVMILVFLVVILIIGLKTAWDNREFNQLKEFCFNVQNSPDLEFPCECIPNMRDYNESAYINEKSKGVCVCTCDIGNNKSYVVEVRMADKEKFNHGV